jgi:hypothetical protein
VSQRERLIFWEVIVSVTLSKTFYMYICSIPNNFRVRAISLYSSKTVDEKEILRTVSNTGIYCSSEIVGTIYLVQYIFENSTVSISALCNSCEVMAYCSSERILTFLYAGDSIHSSISETVRNRTHVHIHILLRMTTSSRSAVGFTQPPIQWVPGSLSPGIKPSGRKADHSPPASAEINKICIYTPTPPYDFTA